MANEPLRGVLALAMAVLPVGCVREAEVVIEQSAGKVMVTVSRGSRRACVDDLDVVPLASSEQGFGQATAWHILTADADRCLDRFVLGQVPADFDQDAALPPLVKGRSYLVEVSGTGFIGAKRFIYAGP